MDGKLKAQIALSDAKAFNAVMLKMGVTALVRIATQQQLKNNCAVYESACCIYRITTGSTPFSAITKYEKEVRAEIALGRKRLGLYDKNISVRFDAEPFLVIEVDPPPGYILTLEEIAQSEKWTARIGDIFTIEKQQPIFFDLTKHHQTLVGAISGHGKSVLVRNCILGLIQSSTPEELTLYLIDFKNDDLSIFKNVKHVKQYAWTDEEATKIISTIRTEIEKRISEANYKVKNRILLVIDEGAELDKELDDTIASIMKMGRSLGVHVLFATQYPTAKQIGVKTARAFTHRFIGRCENASSALWATGVSNSGAELLKKTGSFLYVFGGQVERFQSYYYNQNLQDKIIKSVTKYGRKK